jgi:hypothetical protein
MEGNSHSELLCVDMLDMNMILGVPVILDYFLVGLETVLEIKAARWAV